VSCPILEIARRAKLVRIESLGESLGSWPDELEPTAAKGKISLQAIERLKAPGPTGAMSA